MPTSVACPACGADGTDAANEVIAFNLAMKMSARANRREKVMISAVLGCMAAGLAGVFKALTMRGGFDVLLCLLGSVCAFGMALGVYFWKREL